MHLDAHGKAAERPHDFLRALKNEVLLKHGQTEKNSTNLSAELDQGVPDHAIWWRASGRRSGKSQ
jgi:hypothetical protein